MADDWESLLDEPVRSIAPIKASELLPSKNNEVKHKNSLSNAVKVEFQRTEKNSKEETEEDGLARKLRMSKLTRESDLDSAADLFGISQRKENCAKSASVLQGASDLEKLFDANCIDDFELLADELIQRLKPLEKHSGYVFFLEKFIRALGPSLMYEDSRQLASILTVISNERLRASKESAKTKKKNTAASKKATVKVGGAMDNEDYEDYEEYDD